MVKNAQLSALFDDYFENHRHPTNRLTHKVAIPHNVQHNVAMLDWVRQPMLPEVLGGPVTLGSVAFVLAGAWYLKMDVKLGVLVLAGMALCFPVGRMLTVPAVIGIAVVGWMVQLAGHAVWEKKSPSFLTNLVHALVGPLFFVALLTGDYRIAAEAPETVK